MICKFRKENKTPRTNRHDSPRCWWFNLRSYYFTTNLNSVRARSRSIKH